MEFPDLTLVLPATALAQLAPLLMIISFVMPYLIALMQQRHWSDAVRSRVTLGACAVVAAVLLKRTGHLDFSDLASTSIALFALTVTIYRHFAKANGAAALEEFSTGFASALLENTLLENTTGEKTTDQTTNDEDFS